ncbi:ATP-dependent DNA helicase [Oleiharenicola lentus]|uniref:ATP-dependent DNA helicase n=1 Tax=Oleiharenicola lentus TaxID=2508720 RepID=UPI003F681204
MRDLAQWFNAPVEVIAQQMLDALLLPPIVAVEEVVREKPALNPEQQAAAEHRGTAYLLEAGPGTGKTQTLVARIKGLLTEGVDPRRILVLTFSNKAAAELAARVALQDKEAAAAMWIGTFHAFGLDLLRRFYKELDLPADAALLDKVEAAELLENEFPKLGLSLYRDLYDPTQVILDMLTAISRAKDEVVDAAGYADLGARMKEVAASSEAQERAEKVCEVARVYAAYEALKNSKNCLDFGDLVAMPVRLLESNKAVLALCRSKYDHVLVDEYQDVNHSSIRLLLALKPTGENLWVVGDARQSIYRFRGASSFNVARFGEADFPGGKRGRLTRNYRSTSEITAAFSNFAAQMTVGEPGHTLISERGEGNSVPELRAVELPDQQPVVIADCIEQMRNDGHAYRDQAVLCTGNDAMSELGSQLERLGIPVLYLGSLFERSEAKDMFSLLSLLVDRRAMGLARIGCMPDFSISLQDLTSTLDHVRDKDLSIRAWAGGFEGTVNISEASRNALRRIESLLVGFGPESRSWDVLTSVLLDRTRMAAQFAASTRVADRTRGIALWQVMNFVRSQPANAGLPVQRLLDRVRRLLRLGDDRDLRQLPVAAQSLDAVRLMSIHGAKGLEFPVVHLARMNQGTLPRAAPTHACPPPDGLVAGGTGDGITDARTGHEQEQKCLFYVAASRAKDRFFLYASTKMSGGKRKWTTSEFIDQLGTGLNRRAIIPDRTLPQSPEDAPIQLEIEGNLRFEDRQISQFEICPRRFFYTHILRVGGRRTTTPFLKMHEAVRAVVGDMVKEGPSIDGPSVEERLAMAFEKSELSDHGYAATYRDYALAMLNFFAASRNAHTSEVPTALSLKFGLEEVVVRPDEVFVRGDGVRVLRSIRTGHKPSSQSKKDMVAAALILAAQTAFPGAVVELVYLSDERADEATLSSTVQSNRSKELAGYFQQIREGRFPAESSRSCPSCPSFFICGPVGKGSLRKKF